MSDRYAVANQRVIYPPTNKAIPCCFSKNCEEMCIESVQFGHTLPRQNRYVISYRISTIHLVRHMQDLACSLKLQTVSKMLLNQASDG